MNLFSIDPDRGSASRVTSLLGGSLILLLAVTSLAGCRTYLMATPNLYVNFREDPFATVTEDFQKPYVEIMYGTDRISTTGSKGLVYGYERSRALEFGTCRVELGDDWDTLARASRTHWRAINIPLSVTDLKPIARLPEVPHPETGDEHLEPIEQQSEVMRTLSRLLCQKRQRKEQYRRSDAFIYIHGVNTSFEQAAMVMAQLWHFLGRQGVPMIYSWPAGRGGILNYAYDRESGDFTIYHLKQFLRTIDSCPQLDNIYLIAHSRGTEVLMTALRELSIEDRSLTDDKRVKKIQHVILAAPDMDLEVASQRLVPEKLKPICKRITVYLSQDDRAIALARWIFASVGRLGGLEWNKLSAKEQELLRSITFLTLIDARVKTDFIGHEYFYRNPAVSSDLILLLRGDHEAGKGGRQDLKRKHPDTNFWEIHAGYPRSRKLSEIE